jgi:hypothetical protein
MVLGQLQFLDWMSLNNTLVSPSDSIEIMMRKHMRPLRLDFCSPRLCILTKTFSHHVVWRNLSHKDGQHSTALHLSPRAGSTV